MATGLAFELLKFIKPDEYIVDPVYVCITSIECGVWCVLPSRIFVSLGESIRLKIMAKLVNIEWLQATRRVDVKRFFSVCL